MEQISKIIAAVFFAFLIWYLYSQIKNNKEAFSKQNLGKSFHVMGLLALLLIVFIAVCVFVLRHT